MEITVQTEQRWGLGSHLPHQLLIEEFPGQGYQVFLLVMIILECVSPQSMRFADLMATVVLSNLLVSGVY